MMRILYDYQCFTQPRGGVSRYFHELTQRIPRIADVDVTVPVLFSNNVYLNHRRKILPWLQFRGRGFTTNLIHRRYMSHFLKVSKDIFDLFHPTYYDTYFLKYIGDLPYVITVHDMIHERFPEDFKDSLETRTNKQRLAEGAAKIIAVSENTKRDLVELFSIPSDRIEVVYHGNSLLPSSGGISQAGEYVLYVGSRRAYKNFLPMMEAIAPILRDRRLPLVCAGGGAITKGERALIGKMDLEGLMKWVGDVSDETLAGLYAHALVFVYPSLYEGFGIPILEAFACDCPVAVSSTSSLPEVGGKAVAYFDPRNPDAIRSTVEELIEDPGRRSVLVENGRKRLQEFSWDAAARHTYQIYRTVV